MFNVYYFWNNFKNNVRTLSGWFLTKHPVNKNRISPNPEINFFLHAGVYCIEVGSERFNILIFGYFTRNKAAESLPKIQLYFLGQIQPFFRHLNIQTFILSRPIPPSFSLKLKLNQVAKLLQHLVAF